LRIDFRARLNLPESSAIAVKEYLCDYSDPKLLGMMELILWVNNDLTGFAGGDAPAGSNALDAYFQSDNSQHINFIDESGHVHELYRSPSPGAQWADNDLTHYANADLASLSSRLAGYSQSDNS
jgi:hypothetical protein